MDNIQVKDIWKLQIHIHVLGYYPEGESVLIVLYDNSTKMALKSILVDCYEMNNQNKIEKLLERYDLQKKKLDYVIWTHPDRDHSVGFSNIVANYSSKKTLYLLPEGLSMYSVINDWEKLKSWKAIITGSKFKRTFNVERVNTSNRRISPIQYGSTYYDGINDDINFAIEILTPFASQLFRHFECNKTHKGNHMAISFTIRLGRIGFYFGGDVENIAIEEIESNKLEDLYFVKIPHHGSNTSDRLPSKLNSLQDDKEPVIISVTTGYHKGSSDLPLINVLNLYKNKSSMILKTEDDSHQSSYGIWSCEFDREADSPWRCHCEGDSSVYYNNQEKT